jgi:hypothetical protein
LEINEYLGFFSDLGLFRDKGLLSDELIGHFFGAFIVEAFEYPELKTYIARIRKNFEQFEAFEDFEKIAKASKATRALPASPTSPKQCAPRRQKEIRAMKTVLAIYP